MLGAWFCIRNSADIFIFCKNVKDLPTCRTWLFVLGSKNGKNPYFTTFRGVRGSWLINSKMSGAWFCIRNSADIIIFWKNVKDLPTCRTWLFVLGSKNGKNPYFTTFRGVRGSWLINSKMSGAWFCIRNSADIIIFCKNVKDLPTCRTWLFIYGSNKQ